MDNCKDGVEFGAEIVSSSSSSSSMVVPIVGGE